MFKKMMLLAMAVGALVAFAAPAAAQAEILLEEEGTPLANGSEVTATSSNLTTTITSGPTTGAVLACEKVTLHLTVVSNETNDVVLQQIGASTNTNCAIFAPEPHAATITDGTLGFNENHEITLGEGGTGTTTAHFTADIPAFGAECNLDGSVHVVGTNGTDVLDVGPSALTGSGGALCGNGVIEGSFTLETEGGSVFL